VKINFVLINVHLFDMLSAISSVDFFYCLESGNPGLITKESTSFTITYVAYLKVIILHVIHHIRFIFV